MDSGIKLAETEIEVTDEMRERALAVAMINAEKQLRLPHYRGFYARVDAILRKALIGRLEPRLYRLCWFIRETAQANGLWAL
jgi:hypothetical protein